MFHSAEDFDTDARQALEGVQAQMTAKVVAIEKRLADRFDSQFATVDKRLSSCEVKVIYLNIWCQWVVNHPLSSTLSAD